MELARGLATIGAWGGLSALSFIFYKAKLLDSTAAGWIVFAGVLTTAGIWGF